MSTKIFLTAGTTSWTVPSDWDNSNNTIEALGAGGNGGTANSNISPGGGGGGGSYSSLTNHTLTPGASITVQIGTGGSETDTFFSSSGVLGAGAGKNGTPNFGGSGGIGSANGGTGAGATGGAGGGGGSAAGSSGVGKDGGSSAASQGGGGGGGSNGGTVGTSGGNPNGGNGGNGGTGGTGGSGGSANTSGSPGTNGGGGGGSGAALVSSAQGGVGGNGTEWDGTHGSGGGGGGGTGIGGAGGTYGGGGGGGGTFGAGATGGAGGGGLIVIIYGSASSSSSSSSSSSMGSSGGSACACEGLDASGFTPSSLTMTACPGDQAETTFNVSIAGGRCNWSLSAFDLPAGVTAGFDPPTGSIDLSVRLTLTGDGSSTSQPLTGFVVRLTDQCGNIYDATVDLAITDCGSSGGSECVPDFTLQLTPNSSRIEIQPCLASEIFTLEANGITNDCNDSPDLTIAFDALPLGVNYYFYSPDTTAVVDGMHNFQVNAGPFPNVLLITDPNAANNGWITDGQVLTFGVTATDSFGNIHRATCTITVHVLDNYDACIGGGEGSTPGGQAPCVEPCGTTTVPPILTIDGVLGLDWEIRLGTAIVGFSPGGEAGYSVIHNLDGTFTIGAPCGADPSDFLTLAFQS